MKKLSGVVFAAFSACLLMAALSFAEALENRDIFTPRYLSAQREVPAGSVTMDARVDMCSGERDQVPLVLCQADTEAFVAEETFPVGIADPLEPLNRAFYHFNDKLYFWLMKPLASGYKAVTPEKVRVGVKNIFYNLAFPIRFVNCLLQGKGKEACDEFVRFFTNSTIGMGGFLDVASSKLELKKYEEDLGQTLGSDGAGPAF